MILYGEELVQYLESESEQEICDLDQGEWSDYGRERGPKVALLWLGLLIAAAAVDGGILWLIFG